MPSSVWRTEKIPSPKEGVFWERAISFYGGMDKKTDVQGSAGFAAARETFDTLTPVTLADSLPMLRWSRVSGKFSGNDRLLFSEAGDQHDADDCSHGNQGEGGEETAGLTD